MWFCLRFNGIFLLGLCLELHLIVPLRFDNLTYLLTPLQTRIWNRNLLDLLEFFRLLFGLVLSFVILPLLFIHSASSNIINPRIVIGDIKGNS